MSRKPNSKRQKASDPRPSPQLHRSALLGVVDETDRAIRISESIRKLCCEKMDQPAAFIMLLGPIMDGQIEAMNNVKAFANVLHLKGEGL